MKQTNACPKCASTKLFVVGEVQQKLRGDSGSNEVVPIRAAVAEVSVRSPGIFGDSYERRIREAGGYETWICAGCGFTEWYATNLKQLDALANASSAVRVIERAEDGGPYRG